MATPAAGGRAPLLEILDSAALPPRGKTTKAGKDSGRPRRRLGVLLVPPAVAEATGVSLRTRDSPRASSKQAVSTEVRTHPVDERFVRAVEHPLHEE